MKLPYTKRLADKILSGDMPLICPFANQHLTSSMINSIHECLRDSAKFIVDNVDRWYEETFSSEDGTYKPIKTTDVHNAVLPYPTTWVEARDNGRFNRSCPFYGMLMFQRPENDTKVNQPDFAYILFRAIDPRKIGMTKEERVALNIPPSCTGVTLLSPLLYGVYLDEEKTVQSIYYGELLSPLKDSIMDLIATDDSTHATILLHSLSFINAQNVVTPLILPPKGMSKSHEKKTGLPLNPYRVIRISSQKTTTRDYASDKHESLMSIDHRRCHLKTYTKSNPLFGKWTGTWVWKAIDKAKSKPTYKIAPINGNRKLKEVKENEPPEKKPGQEDM